MDTEEPTQEVEASEDRLPVIAIMARNLKNGIGMNGSIPWKCSLDMEVFRGLSANSFMVMGRKTLEGWTKPITSLNRYNICLTTAKGDELLTLIDRYPNVWFTDSTDLLTVQKEAYHFFKDVSVNKIAVIGGAETINVFQDQIEMLFLSTIDDNSLTDTSFEIPLAIANSFSLHLMQSPIYADRTILNKVEVYVRADITDSFSPDNFNRHILESLIFILKRTLDTRIYNLIP